MDKKRNRLALKISNGDVASFELFYKAEFDNIVFFVNGYLRDESHAKDIAQEALLTLWEKRATIDPDRNIRALVYTIAKNKAINELKAKSLFSDAEDIDEIKANLIALKDNSLDAELDALGLEDLIERTIENLPDTVRESFIMSRKKGMTNKEIAKAKKMSLTGIEYHMKVSIQIFKNELKEYLPLWGWVLLFCIYNS